MWWGGGNSLNIIRIPSLNESRNIIFSSDLNGSIAPFDFNVWNHIVNYLWLTQNNVNDTEYVIGTADTATTVLSQYSLHKNTAYTSGWYMRFAIRFIIEFKE